MINTKEGTLTLADGVTLSKQQMDLIFDVIHIASNLRVPTLIAFFSILRHFGITGGLYSSDYGVCRGLESNDDE